MSGTSQRERSLLQSTKMKVVGNLKRTMVLDMEMQSLEFAQLVTCLALEITVISWMNLRRALELWTFNIVETAIDYEDFES